MTRPTDKPLSVGLTRFVRRAVDVVRARQATEASTGSTVHADYSAVRKAVKLLCDAYSEAKPGDLDLP